MPVTASIPIFLNSIIEKVSPTYTETWTEKFEDVCQAMFRNKK